MRSPNTTILLLAVMFSSCIGVNNDTSTNDTRSIRGILSNAGLQSNTTMQRNGVAIEHSVRSGNFLNAYNSDNEIYRPGRIWRYQLKAAKNNQLHKFEVNRRGDWRLVPAGKRSNGPWQKVDELVMEVVDGFGPYDQDFNQTVIKYSYRISGKKDTNEFFTGLVENGANVWLHPLRKDLFEILALNPYPFVQRPLEVGKRFDFELPVHENWSNPEWKKWYGTLENNCKYEIVKKRKVDLAFGVRTPFAVMSECENEIGSTGLVAYFDEEMGFVKLDYRNIDDSWLSLELVSPPY